MIDDLHRAFIAPLVALSLLVGCSSDGMMSALPSAPPSTSGPPQSQTSVDVPFCNAVAPDWVAFQDGDGPWTRVMPVTDGQKTRFRYTFTADRGAIAAVRIFPPGNRGTGLVVQYGRPAELVIAGDTSAVHCGPAATTTFFGTVDGVSVNDAVEVTAGFGASALLAPSQPRFSLRGLIPGTQDILARKRSRVDGAVQLTAIILRRVPDLPDGTTLSTLDFNSAEAVAPVLSRATLEGPEIDGAFLTTSFTTPYSQSVLGSFMEAATGSRRTIVALPGELLRGGDVQIATATAVAADGARRDASAFFAAPRDLTVTLGAQATAPVFTTVSTTPCVRLRAAFDPQSDYDRSTSIAFQQGSVRVSVSVTGAYARIAPSGYDLVVPDLSNAAGFRSEWALQPGNSIFWTATRVGGSLGLGANADPSPGATWRSAERFGSLNP